jgi:lipopolysaccharide biosynthesis regulator YciM
VHEHLLSRADLTSADRQRAQHGLALDFLKAGLLDRAEEALRKLEGTAYEGQARLARLAIYERSREWPEAARVARLLENSGEANFAIRMAHYQCEQAREAVQQGDTLKALHILTDTVQSTPDAARPRILLGQLQLSLGQAPKAFDTLSTLFERSDAAAPLAAASLAKAAQAAGLTQPAIKLLETHYDKQVCIDVLEAITTLEAQTPEGSAASHQRLLKHLNKQASLMAATRWLTEEHSATTPLPAVVQTSLEQAIRPLARYRCAACGFEAKEHFWHCPGCQAWDSYPPRRIEEL